MPDSSDNYQLPSWPPTLINRDLWNAVMGSISERLIAREELEADFEALIAQGTQASLDYIQATVAPQIATIQASIELAQEQINQIIVDGIAPNSAKLGGQLPAYYATAASVIALNTAVGLRATTVYVDDELLELATAVQAVLDQKANQSTTIVGGGLASGGGNLSGNRTITVTKATDAEHQARTRDDVAATPKGVGLAVAAYNKWETVPNGLVTPVAQNFVALTNLSPFVQIRVTSSLSVSAISNLLLQVSADNGATWDAAVVYGFVYLGSANGGAPVAANGTLTGFLLNVAMSGTEQSQQMCTIGQFNKAALSLAIGKACTVQPGTLRTDLISCRHPSSVAFNALRILSSAAATISGTIHVEGLRG